MTHVIICSGIKRSASTWSFNVCRELGAHIARAADRELFSGYDDDTDRLIRKLSQEDVQSGAERVVVIKSHVPGEETRAWARQGRISNICTIRDPRDCFASMELTWPGKDYGESVERRIRNFRHWLGLAGEFNDDGASLIVRFEDMKSDALGQIRRISDYLGIDRSEQLLEEISISTGVEASQARIDRMVARKKSPRRVYHERTQLHEKHLNGGKIGRWREELRPEVQEMVHEAFLPWLAKFGYDE